MNNAIRRFAFYAAWILFAAMSGALLGLLCDVEPPEYEPKRCAQYFNEEPKDC